MRAHIHTERALDGGVGLGVGDRVVERKGDSGGADDGATNLAFDGIGVAVDHGGLGHEGKGGRPLDDDTDSDRCRSSSRCLRGAEYARSEHRPDTRRNQPPRLAGVRQRHLERVDAGTVGRERKWVLFVATSHYARVDDGRTQACHCITAAVVHPYHDWNLLANRPHLSRRCGFDLETDGGRHRRRKSSTCDCN